MDEYPYPIGYGVSLCPAEAEPAFGASDVECGIARLLCARCSVGLRQR